MPPWAMNCVGRILNSCSIATTMAHDDGAGHCFHAACCAFPEQLNKRRREDNSRAASPAPVAPERAIYHGVKAENDAFRAVVVHKNQTVDLGLFPTAEDAARAYDRKVSAGEFCGCVVREARRDCGRGRRGAGRSNIPVGLSSSSNIGHRGLPVKVDFLTSKQDVVSPMVDLLSRMLWSFSG